MAQQMLWKDLLPYMRGRGYYDVVQLADDAIATQGTDWFIASYGAIINGYGQGPNPDTLMEVVAGLDGSPCNALGGWRRFFRFSPGIPQNEPSPENPV